MLAYNHTAALLLKLSIEKLLPHAKGCQTEATPQGFSCTFTYKESFEENYLPLIEKQMRDFSKKEFKCTERLASNVRELALYHNKHSLARECEGKKGMIWLVELGDEWGLSFIELVPCLFFTLLSFQVDRGRVIISGQAFASEQEKQNVQKKWRQYEKKNHEVLARTLSLYEKFHWHPRGVKFKNVLYELWIKFLNEVGIEEVETSDPQDYYRLTSTQRFATWNNRGDHLYFFGEISLPFILQMIQNWVKIFGLNDSKWVLTSPKKGKALEEALKKAGFPYETEEGEVPVLELRITDNVNRYWTVSFVKCAKDQASFSLLADSNRFVALLLEHYEGSLPYWLQPEQVCLIPIGDVSFESVCEIFSRQKVRVHIDKDPLPLKEKMHRALRMKVPYVMVFGKQEAESGCLKVRVYGSNRDDIVKLEDLEHFLLERQLESQ